MLPCPHFYSTPGPREAQHVTPPPLAPSGLTSALRGLNWSHLTQAPEPRANPQGKDKLLNNYINFYTIRLSFKGQFRLNTREATNLQSIINTFSEATQGACFDIQGFCYNGLIDLRKKLGDVIAPLVIISLKTFSLNLLYLGYH